MAIGAGAALPGHISMVECDVNETYRVMTNVTRQIGVDMGRIFTGGPDTIVAVGALIAGLRVIDGRQQRLPTGIHMACLALNAGQRMVGRFRCGGPAVAIHTAATVHKVVIKRRRIGPVAGVLMTGFTGIGGQRMITAE